MGVITQDWLIAAVVIAVAACLQGTGGVGFGMVAAPVMAILMPELLPGPMLLLGLMVAVLAVARERAALDPKGLGFALAGRLPTSILAATLIGVLPLRMLSIVFALVILAGVAMSVAITLRGRRIVPSPGKLFAAGLVSGFMGTITSVGTPPIALVYQNADAPALRATIGAYLVAGTLISIAALAAVGRFGLHDLTLGAWLALPLAAGFAISGPLASRLPRAAMRWLVLALSGAAAALLLIRQMI
ncbi:permease [Tistrella bauzanensis]|uniref:Probable membrane transporter protein n=1 Tax=Tistrella bauzanensis TaxID=657419 RepID=A0ABQ1IW69_9PROT|nr:sulfite exporter TauE/SafE family protein [Tistrella bauzanensis]GGB51094.1 permease [Tistrella bauzanensis]